MAIPNDKIRVTTILTKSDKDKLKALAAKDLRSLSSYIAVILEAHLKKKGGGK